MEPPRNIFKRSKETDETVKNMAEKLRFFDIKAKKAFETDKFEVKVVEQKKRGRKVRIAFATSPYTGIRVARILGPVEE
jgi:predicted O-linked N-acetylglucosamine transferase (SPINDLY family)